MVQIQRIEALGELRVGEKRNARVLCSGTDDWNPQVVGQEPDRVEKNALLWVPASIA